MTMDEEVKVILEDLPVNKIDFDDTFGKANCWVTIGVSATGKRRLEIFPKTGGWLGVDVELLLGDLAPYSGQASSAKAPTGLLPEITLAPCAMGVSSETKQVKKRVFFESYIYYKERWKRCYMANSRVKNPYNMHIDL